MAAVFHNNYEFKGEFKHLYAYFTEEIWKFLLRGIVETLKAKADEVWKP